MKGIALNKSWKHSEFRYKSLSSAPTHMMKKKMYCTYKKFFFSINITDKKHCVTIKHYPATDLCSLT